MIKKIVLEEHNSFSKPKTIELNFEEGINVIVGRKGAGKSTLFDMLVGLENNQIYEWTTDALKDYGLRFVYAINGNGDMIKDTELTPIDMNQKGDKNNKGIVSKFPNVIPQNDEIKVQIDSNEKILSEKKEFLRKQLLKSQNIENVISDVLGFRTALIDIADANNSSVVWNNISKLNLVTDKDVNKLHQKNYVLDVRGIEQKINELKTLGDSISEVNDLIKRSNVSENLAFVNAVEFDEERENAIVANKKLLRLISIEMNKNKALVKFFKAFDDSVSFAKARVSKKMDEEDKKIASIKNFRIASHDHVVNVTEKLIKAKKHFDKIFNNEEEISMNFGGTALDSTGMMELRLDKTIYLEPQFMKGLLKGVVYGTQKTFTRMMGWIESNSSSPRRLDTTYKENIIKKFQEELLEHVQIFVDGKNYHQMSLGERSIHGMTFVMRGVEHSPLFLDQPEDNLDNDTIASQLVPEILKNKNQIFIVTHNANIGFLTNPKNVVVADMKEDKFEDKYYNGKFVSENRLDAVHFLEGGIQILEDRFKIIKGEEND